MNYAQWLLALCAWREARGQTPAAQRGVIWSVLNRAQKPGWWGKDIVSVILHPFQYSSFNSGDPNALKFPNNSDPVFAQIAAMAQDPGVDPTGGAVNYHDSSLLPEWAASGQFVETVQIDSFTFYRLAA